METKDPAHRPLGLIDTPIWPRDSPGGGHKNTLVREARSNPTGHWSVLATWRASLHRVLGNLQVTCTEEMTIPTLPILHRLLENCEWLREKLPRSLARMSLPFDLHEAQERWAWEAGVGKTPQSCIPDLRLWPHMSSGLKSDEAEDFRD